VSDILSDPQARALTFGSDSVLATRFWTAVKTGTSKDMRDNWAVGYSEHYTVGVWVGNASGAPMWDVSGTTGAAPIWADVMRHLHRERPSRAPTPPAGVVSTRTHYAQAQEASRNEWFLSGTETALVHQDAINSIADSASNTPANSQNGLKITSPSPGTIIALDPDIPPRHQRLQLRSNAPPQAGIRWLLDGKELARGAQAAWLPWPGRHVIALANAQGQVLDEVKIEVRGAGVKLARK
jgi:penicillin-binding protein 1C